MSLTKEAIARVIRAHDDWAERVAPDDPIACKCGHRITAGSCEDHQIEMVWALIEANTTTEWGTSRHEFGDCLNWGSRGKAEAVLKLENRRASGRISSLVRRRVTEWEEA